jgi:CHASE2 domain-containing sensor protein
MTNATFRLKVQKIEQTCLFQLSWGQGLEITATLTYPTLLFELYQEWQRVYLNFYKSVSLPAAPLSLPTANDGLRSRVKAAGGLTPAVDWRVRLVEAETRLLNEFHRWLRGSELYDIRAAIAQASQASAVTQHPIDVFITCNPLELARLPWESWEIGSDFATVGTIRIIRTPSTIRRQPKQVQRRRPRILAILGDESGLNFQTDREAVQSLSRLASVRFMGWQPGQTAEAVKTQIQQAIADEDGWDILLFAGHSNENQVAGGELAIAPGVSILVREIAPQLIAAQSRGLQFALFNSCSGLNIAESLIDLGFNQVGVMREPIHNRVAQDFLVRFLQSLAAHKDVHESFLAACQHLRLDKNLTYPSAFLVPSLFGHPGADWYRIPNWKEQLWQLVPTRIEAIALATCFTLSLIPSVQTFLLDRRIEVQAMYRHFTGQVARVERPPIALVQIDRESLERANVTQINPLDRTYLAAIVQRLTALDTPVIGVDYLLDAPQPETNAGEMSGDRALSNAVNQSIRQQSTWFVFASVLDGNEEVGIHPATGIASPPWSLQGFTNSDAYHMMLLYPNENCAEICPFSYVLALAHQAQQTSNLATLPQQQQQRSETLSLRSATIDHLNSATLSNPNGRFWNNLRISGLTVWFYQRFRQQWFTPIIDYSIPPQHVYDRIAAWSLLDETYTDHFSHLPHQIVIIAAGQYDQAGIAAGQGDSFNIPAATQFWHKQRIDQQRLNPEADDPVNSPAPRFVLTGGELLAYSTHQLIHNHLIRPIPDTLMVGIAILLGKGIAVWLKRRQSNADGLKQGQRIILIGSISGSVLYGLASLQLYISSAVLLPWLLPSVVLWSYITPLLRRKRNG